MACLWFVAAGLLASAAHAKGTHAGTLVPNAATIVMVYDGQPVTIVSKPAVFMVAELIDVTLTWQDGAPVSVKAGETARVLTFALTNTGNGTETFSLDGNYAVTGDSFDPVPTPAGALYLESGKQAGLQTSGPNADILLLSGAATATLAADASQVVYVLGDIPATAQDGGQGNVQLTARSTTPGAAGARPGTGLSGLGDDGADAVVGLSRALASTTGGYALSDVVVKVEKSIKARLDPKGTDRVMPGTVLTYQIKLSVSGSGTAHSVVVTDPLPSDLTYVAGSLSVDGRSRTDSTTDSDNAGFDAGTLTVNLGEVLAPATVLIEFKATVN